MTGKDAFSFTALGAKPTSLVSALLKRMNQPPLDKDRRYGGWVYNLRLCKIQSSHFSSGRVASDGLRGQSLVSTIRTDDM